MRTAYKNIIGIIFGILSLSLSTGAMTQDDDENTQGEAVRTSLTRTDTAALLANLKQQGPILTKAAVFIADVIDVANHRCCTGTLPELVTVLFAPGDDDEDEGVYVAININALEADEVTDVNAEIDDNSWLYFDFEPLTEESNTQQQSSLSFETETSTTVAGFDDVRTTLTGEVFKEGIVLEAVLGADGELFGETLQYTLELVFEDTSFFAIPVPRVTVEKVRTANGKSTEASFSSGASADGGDTTKSVFSTDEQVVMQGTINIDPADQGMAGEIYVALLTRTADGKVSVSFMNTDSAYEAWDLKVKNLGAHITTDSLKSSYNITIHSGTLVAGYHRVALAYSTAGGKLVFAPKALEATAE